MHLNHVSNQMTLQQNSYFLYVN